MPPHPIHLRVVVYKESTAFILVCERHTFPPFPLDPYFLLFHFAMSQADTCRDMSYNGVCDGSHDDDDDEARADLTVYFGFVISKNSLSPCTMTSTFMFTNGILS